MRINDHELQYEVSDNRFHFSGGFGDWRFCLHSGDVEEIKAEMQERAGLAANAARHLDGGTFAKPGYYYQGDGGWRFVRPPAARLDGRQAGTVTGSLDDILWSVQVDGHPREAAETFVDLHVSEARRLGLENGDRVTFRGEYVARMDCYSARDVARA